MFDYELIGCGFESCCCHLKQVSARAISWNKCRSERTTKIRNNNLDYMIDPNLWNIIRMFILSIKNAENDPTRDSSDKSLAELLHVISRNQRF